MPFNRLQRSFSVSANQVLKYSTLIRNLQSVDWIELQHYKEQSMYAGMNKMKDFNFALTLNTVESQLRA
jgi:hypothetical protein